MFKQIDKWVREHRNFEKLLEIVEQQLESFRRSERPDYELMLDIIYYMTHYPDQFHHPGEDIVFRRVAEREKAAGNAVEELHHQHRVIAENGRALQEQLDAVVTGVMLPRTQVELPARKYAEYFRNHMRNEESVLFPLAQRLLSDADWAVIDAQTLKGIDPLFGGRVQKRYRALHGRIAAQAHCGCEVA